MTEEMASSAEEDAAVAEMDSIGVPAAAEETASFDDSSYQEYIIRVYNADYCIFELHFY